MLDERVEMDTILDISHAMSPSPTAMRGDTLVSRVFDAFRVLGLRHVVVLSDSGSVLGIITRHDLVDVQNHPDNYKGMIHLLVFDEKKGKYVLRNVD